MRKRFFVLLTVVAAALVATVLCACSSPEETRITRYTIDAVLSDDHTLSATVTVDYVNNTDVPLNELMFHLYPNAFREGARFSPVAKDRITEAYPNGRSYGKMTVEKVTVGGAETEIGITGDDENILCVPLGGTLEPTDAISVGIEYTVKLPNIRHRFGYTDKSVNLANFYPIACVYRDGGFATDPYYSTGDPFFSECANYSVKLTAPSALVGAFTGTVTSETKGESATVYEISANNVRDFAAVFGDYQKMSGLSGGTIVNYLYYKDSDPEKALAAAIDSLRIFGEMFGAYPYKEYSVVQTGFLQGGMEYPCLSMVSDAFSGASLADIIVHETAHQWWYGLVGNDEVRHSWMDEALAEYSTMMFYEKAEGYSYTFDGKRADALGAYMLYCETYKNNGAGDTTMTRALGEYENETEYSYMIYVKGALMLDDIRAAVGTENFISGLKRYCAENKYKIAKPQDLVGAMEKASKRTLAPLFESWLNGNVKLYSSH